MIRQHKNILLLLLILASTSSTHDRHFSCTRSIDKTWTILFAFLLESDNICPYMILRCGWQWSLLLKIIVDITMVPGTGYCLQSNFVQALQPIIDHQTTACVICHRSNSYIQDTAYRSSYFTDGVHGLNCHQLRQQDIQWDYVITVTASALWFVFHKSSKISMIKCNIHRRQLLHHWCTRSKPSNQIMLLLKIFTFIGHHVDSL